MQNLQPDQLLAFGIFLVGTLCLTILSVQYANIFKNAAKEDAENTVKQASITFVSGHFLAFFVLPFAIVIAASLAILGKLDSGVSAILSVIITYIVQKVTIR